MCTGYIQYKNIHTILLYMQSNTQPRPTQSLIFAFNVENTLSVNNVCWTTRKWAFSSSNNLTLTRLNRWIENEPLSAGMHIIKFIRTDSFISHMKYVRLVRLIWSYSYQLQYTEVSEVERLEFVVKVTQEFLYFYHFETLKCVSLCEILSHGRQRPKPVTQPIQ